SQAAGAPGRGGEGLRRRARHLRGSGGKIVRHRSSSEDHRSLPSGARRNWSGEGESPGAAIPRHPSAQDLRGRVRSSQTGDRAPTASIVIARRARTDQRGNLSFGGKRHKWRPTARTSRTFITLASHRSLREAPPDSSPSWAEGDGIKDW